MLSCLRHDPFIRRNDHEDAIDAGGAGDHGPNEVLMPGNIDQVQDAAGSVEIGEPEHDGEAALPLFSQSVGLYSSQRSDECCLTVVNMPDHAERELTCHVTACSSAAARSDSSRAKTVRRSRCKTSSAIRPMTGISDALNRSASSVAVNRSARISMTFVGISSIGKLPPPL